MIAKNDTIYLILFLLTLLFVIFVYKAKPVKDFEDTDYLIIANNLTNELFTNKYFIEQLPTKGNVNQIASLVGYDEDGIIIACYYSETKIKKKNYYLLRYILKNKTLVVDNVIDLKIKLEDEKDFIKILHIDKDDLYYYQKSNNEIFKYNILTHQKESLFTIEDCRHMWSFNGRYLNYTVKKTIPYNIVVSKLVKYKDKYEEEKIAKFEGPKTIELIPGKDILLMREESQLSYYNLKSHENIYISDVGGTKFTPVDSGKKIVYLNFYTKIFRLLYGAKGPWYYDFILLDIETGEEDKIFQLHGTAMYFMVINLNDYPNFR